MTMRTKTQSRRSGFTLIELVMVIMILAIVAGLAVPIVGWLRRSANYAAQANTQAAIGSNLEFFRTTFGNNGYPDNLDSLVLDDVSDIVPTTDDTPTGYLDHGFDFLTLGNLTADETACFNWLDTVYDHEQLGSQFATLQDSPSNSATTARPFDGQNVAIAYDPAVGPTTETEQLLMLSEIYPEGVPADVTLVAFGIGPSNSMIGRTMQSVPVDPRVDPSQVYGRYVAIFACYDSDGDAANDGRQGRRAQLKLVLNAFGRTNNNAISEFWSSFAPE
ncbi:MAG: type II secretion system protein [Planctomycetota bacterium]